MNGGLPQLPQGATSSRNPLKPAPPRRRNGASGQHWAVHGHHSAAAVGWCADERLSLQQSSRRCSCGSRKAAPRAERMRASNWRRGAAVGTSARWESFGLACLRPSVDPCPFRVPPKLLRPRAHPRLPVAQVARFWAIPHRVARAKRFSLADDLSPHRPPPPFSGQISFAFVQGGPVTVRCRELRRRCRPLHPSAPTGQILPPARSHTNATNLLTRSSLPRSRSSGDSSCSSSCRSGCA